MNGQRALNLSEALAMFIALGQKIALTDPSAWYGKQFLASDVPLNPGYMARKSTRLCVVNLNPQLGEGKPWVSKTYEQIRSWGKSGTREAYDRWYNYWLDEHFPNWPVYRWLEPVFTGCGLSKDEISWLNVCKMPTKDSNDVSRDMCVRDSPWLVQQLAIIQPQVILVGTVKAKERINQILRTSGGSSTLNAYTFDLVQNRNRNQTAAHVANRNLASRLAERLSAVSDADPVS